MEKVDAFGNVEIRTQTEVIRGDRGTYVPDTGLARILGHVHVTRGLNQLNGEEALVNMHTGVSTLSRTPGGRVEGLVMPNDASAGHGDQPGGQAAPKPAKRP
jgi:lipopolysaccharide export system protein LptA